jgi:DNA-binding CsgD family transcriptional regulator
VIKLTARELEVLTLIANGFTQAETAEQLGLTERAAANASDRARMRLGALSAPHAVLLAVRAGILEGRPKRRPGPARQPLTARQAEVLDAASDGASLATVARRIDTTSHQVSARLSEAYLRLGVTDLPRLERRAAAVAEARRRGLIPAANQERAA